jgi:hypothetical protein
VHTQRRNNQWFIVLVGAIALVLAACGGGSPSASASGTGSTSTTTPRGGFQNAAFQTCLKQHGVALPPRNGGNRPGAGGPGGGGTPNSIPGLTAAQQSALNACRSQLPSGGRNRPGGANSQALQAYLSCLSDHGVTVPTTTSGSSASGTRASGSVLNAVRNDPKFAAANQTCRALLPTPGGSTTTTNGTG